MRVTGVPRSSSEDDDYRQGQHPGGLAKRGLARLPLPATDLSLLRTAVPRKTRQTRSQESRLRPARGHWVATSLATEALEDSLARPGALRGGGDRNCSSNGGGEAPAGSACTPC